MPENASLYSSHQAMFRESPIMFVMAVALIAVYGVGLPILALWYFVSRSTRLEIDSERIVYTKGLFSKDRTILARSGIRSVRVSQTLFQRLMDVGTVRITTAGDRPEVTAPGMPEARRIRDLLSA